MSELDAYYLRKKRDASFLALEKTMDSLADQITHTEGIIYANQQYSKHLEDIINTYQQSRIDNPLPEPENKE